jgi:tRNA (cytidine/uridine-2'-O-)-methyltransferase
MFNIVLIEPEIPPNTGNIIRLCANSGATLHLIEPLGFKPDDTKLKRAGLDYHDWAKVKIHASLDHCLSFINNPQRVFACSTHGTQCYSDVHYQTNDVFLFGPETRGIAKNILATFAKERVLRIPMQSHSRSLNLSNAVAIQLYEAWRQLEFLGAR